MKMTLRVRLAGAAILTTLAGFSMAESLACPAWAYARFYGKSTLHPFQGHTDTVRFTARGTVDTAGGDTLAQGEARVEVRSLTTNHDARDRDMYKMFESQTHPFLTVRAPAVSLSRLRPNGQPSPEQSGSFPLEMTIRDRTQRHLARVAAWQEDDQSCRFSVEFRVSLESYELEPPAPFWGALRVDDTVRVEADIEIRKDAVRGSEQ